MTAPPVQAVALFFDDIRQETGNKLSFMGQLLGTAFLTITEPPQSMDRLAIVIHARWPLSFQPREIMLRVAISDRVVIEQTAEAPDNDTQTLAQSEFSGRVLQAAIMLRGQPLKPGDEIKAWLRVDGTDIPAGRLRLQESPAA